MHPELRYAKKKLHAIIFGKYLFELKVRFAVEKKIEAISILLQFFENFCCRNRKMLVIQFSYMEIV